MAKYLRYCTKSVGLMFLSLAAVAQVDSVRANEREDLPRVLLLGDSISLGYDQPARDLLAGKVRVHHPPENCQSTVYGLEKIEEWLGDEPWDVIHFNWGIWDAHHLEDDRLRTTTEEYEHNLRKLVSRLKATGAKLIWASTTPMKTLHQNGIRVEGSDIPVRNDIARKVMIENAIPINDLYGEMLTHVGRLQGDDGCHFTPEGYAFLAQRVAERVLNTYEGEGLPIRNGVDRRDTQGNLIAAHDGGISRFNGVFYWYGSSYAGNPQGKYDVADGPVWNGVQVYRSTDLSTWTYEGVALPRPKKGWGMLGATGRAHVIYNDKTQKYVMWYRWFLHMPSSFLMVAVADHPEGPFTSLGPREVGTANGFASDMDVFKDDDGKAYLIYCDHETEATKFAENANGRYAVRIDSLTDDYLDSNKDGIYVFEKAVEAPGMIRYKGKYIAVGSGVHGWDSSETVYAVADAPLGPYHGPKVMSENKTWDSQVTDLIYLKESDTVMALCDQWWVPDKTDLNRSRYLFLPLLFNSETRTARMVYRDSWNPFDGVEE